MRFTLHKICKKDFFYKSLKAILYISAITLLIFQIHGVVTAFLEAQTTYSISKMEMTKLFPPTIVICPKVKNLKTTSIGFESSIIRNDAFFKQFHWLGQQFNISVNWVPVAPGIKWHGNLTLGNNLGILANFLKIPTYGSVALL